MRLIDADAIDTRYSDPEVIETLETAPTVDAVQVVRCRDCAKCYEEMPNALWCQGRGWPNCMVPPDGFCDKGKRRE